jgi:hypothetical protein
MLLSDGRLSQTRSARNDKHLLTMAPSTCLRTGTPCGVSLRVANAFLLEQAQDGLERHAEPPMGAA